MSHLDANLNKQLIITLFNNNVRGKEIQIGEDVNSNHSGKYGHWLETQMGVAHNAKNEPDINGYEMKTGKSVTTFIDKSPDAMLLNGMEIPKRNKILKSQFWEKHASIKQSSEPTIGGWKVDRWNALGQKMVVNEDNSVSIVYNYAHDTRTDKESEESEENKESKEIMKWNAQSLRHAIENKFNKNGFFKCIKCPEGRNVYTKICFGSPITFDMWVNKLKSGIIYHDGYSKLNGRGRHVFRAMNDFWDGLIVEEF